MSNYKFMHGVDGRFISGPAFDNSSANRFVAMETPIPYDDFDVENILQQPVAGSPYIPGTNRTWSVTKPLGVVSNYLKTDIMLIYHPDKRLRVDLSVTSPQSGYIFYIGGVSVSFKASGLPIGDVSVSDGVYPGSVNASDSTHLSPAAYVDQEYYRMRGSVEVRALGWWTAGAPAGGTYAIEITATATLSWVD
jgi:hypothetical protein